MTYKESQTIQLIEDYDNFAEDSEDEKFAT